ncbi:MAG: hypothetical protein IJ371_04090 [Clostridia bacterium]|nr:hypothetical protein [Clostridia bacterium]
MNTIFNLEMIIDYFKRTRLSVKLFCKIYKLNRDDFEKILVDDIDVSSQFVYDLSKILKVELKDMFNKNYKFDY